MRTCAVVRKRPVYRHKKANNRLFAEKMGKNESVTVDVLTRICNALDCDVYDVLEIKKHGEEA